MFGSLSLSARVLKQWFTNLLELGGTPGFSFESENFYAPLKSLKFDTRAEEAVKTFWERGIFGICRAYTYKPGVLSKTAAYLAQRPILVSFLIRSNISRN